MQNSDYVGFDYYVFRPINDNYNNITCQPDGFDPDDYADMHDWFHDVERYIACATPAGGYSCSGVMGFPWANPGALALLKTLKAPSQEIIIIAEASADSRPYPTHVQQQQYFDWALPDADIVGLMWYKWQTGVRDHRETWPVHAAWAHGHFSPLELPTEFCGDWDYLPEDVTHDCYVDIRDFAVVAGRWMDCTDPADPATCVNALE